MCCRISSKATHERLAQLFKASSRNPEEVDGFSKPGKLTTVIGQDLEGNRVLAKMRWGFKLRGQILHNARSENVKPRFMDSFLHRRCIVPTNGFYEGKGFFVPTEERPFALGGIWEKVYDVSYIAILTTAAQGVVQNYHHRMPVILPENSWNAWLNRKQTNYEDIQRIIQDRYPSELIRLSA